MTVEKCLLLCSHSGGRANSYRGWDCFGFEDSARPVLERSRERERELPREIFCATSFKPWLLFPRRVEED